MSSEQQYVYALLIDDEFVGLYDSFEAAKKMADSKREWDTAINRIPLNKVSYFEKVFDCIWDKETDDTRETGRES